MSPWDGVPGQLQVLAARAGALAEEVRERGAEVRVRARTEWSGPAAEAYATQATTEAARLDRCASELDDLVAALRGHAQGARHRLDDVAALFAEAREALEAAADLVTLDPGGRR